MTGVAGPDSSAPPAHSSSSATSRMLRGVTVALLLALMAQAALRALPSGHLAQLLDLGGARQAHGKAQSAPISQQQHVSDSAFRTGQGSGGAPQDRMAQVASPSRQSHPARTADAGALHSGQGQGEPSCRLSGSVDECCNCTFQAVDDINERVVYPTLKRLVATPFFRYFKVNLYCDCPLWPDDSMCALQACSVCECEPNELPAPWLAAEARDCTARRRAAEADGVVDRGMEPGMRAALHHIKGWRGVDNPWMAPYEQETDGNGSGNGEEEEFLYINLLANPERYTGYQGEHAHRIWSAIYNQSGFQDLGDACVEARVFYRLISGMHSSISAHIAAHYLLDEEAGLWGPSLPQFKARLGRPELQDRVQNLYFAYLFVLRAVSKAGGLLAQLEYDTGQPEQDAVTRALITELVSRSELHEACPMPFDEGRLWRGEGGPALLGAMQATFRNITRVMDCVGCEKCKLWGKLQTLGIATALKVLFSSPDCAGNVPDPGAPFSALALERNEVIALVNLLERFAASLHYYTELSAAQVADEPASQLLGAGATVQ